MLFNLLSKEILEGLASVQRLGGGSFPLDGRPRREKVALVSDIFLWNACRYRLRAFEACGGIEVGTLFATMQVNPTSRAFACKFDIRGKDGGARGTPHHLAFARHQRSLRPETLVFWPRFLFGSVRVMARILVTSLTVLSITHVAPSQTFLRYSSSIG
jgi:hypothetical protein